MYYIFKHCNANYQDNFTNSHVKQTNDLNLINKVSDFDDSTDSANFWATNSSNNAISNKYVMGLGAQTTIPWLSGFGYVAKDSSVKLGMENNEYEPYNCVVTGECDFK